MSVHFVVIVLRTSMSDDWSIVELKQTYMYVMNYDFREVLIWKQYNNKSFPSTYLGQSRKFNHRRNLDLHRKSFLMSIVNLITTATYADYVIVFQNELSVQMCCQHQRTLYIILLCYNCFVCNWWVKIILTITKHNSNNKRRYYIF